MKQTISFLLCLFLIGISNAQVGIGTTSPDASSALHILSLDRGLLIPRLTIIQRANIANPANGLLIFNTDNNQFQYNSNTSLLPIWKNLTSSLENSTIGQTMKYGNTDTTSNINANTQIKLPVFGILE